MEKSLKFTLGKPSELNEVWDFLMAHFFPDEPMTRSCLLPVLLGPDTEEKDAIKDIMFNHFLAKCLINETSVIVRNEDNDIRGVMMAAVHDRAKLEPPPDIDFSKFSKKPVWCYKFNDLLENEPNEQLKKHPDCQLMAFGDILCVHQSARGQGLGKRMLEKSMETVSALGSEYYFSALTGIYSQAIFEKAGFDLVKVFVYDDFKDDEGNIVIDKQGEHKQCKTMIKRLQ